LFDVLEARAGTGRHGFVDSQGHESRDDLIEGKVRPTLEVVLVESPAHLRKRHDRESGLALVDP
jgi:predicted DNA-binding protein with PD1-like motif